MELLLIMLVVAVGMKLFANDNENNVKNMGYKYRSNNDGFKNRQKQRDYEKRISNIDFELKKTERKRANGKYYAGIYK